MISNGEKQWHYSAVKKLSVLSRRIRSKHYGDFYYLNCPHSFRTKNKLESHKNVNKNKDFCNVIMLSNDTKMLEFNQYQKSDKTPFIIYTDLECITEKIAGSANNPEKSSTTKVSEHISSGFPMSATYSFRSIEKKCNGYKGKDCMKNVWEGLKEHTIKIINFKKKKLKLLTKEQQESYKKAKFCYICKEKFENKYLKHKKYCKVRDHCHYIGKYTGAAHSLCNLKYRVPKKIHIVFYDGSYYGYHFIIKELAEEFKKQFTCLVEISEQYITCTFPIEKEVTRIDENGEEITKNISYLLKFIANAGCMASSLPNLVNNLSEEIQTIKCKFGHYDKKCETCRINYKYCDCFMEYTNFKDDLIECKCWCCNKRYQKKFDEKLKEQFFIIYKFSNNDHSKFISLLQKRVYTSEYMDD